MGNKTVTFEQNATIFGIKVTRSEADPKNRITPLNDLKGTVPVTISSSGKVNYGTIQSSFLFKAMNHVVLKSFSSSEEIELNPNNYSLRLSGGSAPQSSSGSNYNVFAKINKVYTYQYSDDNYEYYYISDKKVDNNYSAIGFQKENSEATNLYMGTYLGSYDNTRLRSISGYNARNRQTIIEFIDMIKSYGSGYSLEQFQMINLYQIAYLMMFQTFYSQDALGFGRTIRDSVNPNTANLSTGVFNTDGAIAYNSTTKGVKFMHLEDFVIDTGYSFVEGLAMSNENIYSKMKPPYAETLSDFNSITSTYNNTNENFLAMGATVSSSTLSNKLGKIPHSWVSVSLITSYEAASYPYAQGSGNLAVTRNGVFNYRGYSADTVPNLTVARLCLLS